MRFEATKVSNADLVSISKHCSLLQEVTICVSEVITEETASQAARNWHHLRRLGLHLTNATLALYENEEDVLLGHLCTENAVISLIRHIPQLTYLNALYRAEVYNVRYSEFAQDKECADPRQSKLRELYVDSLSRGGFDQIRLMCRYLHLLALHRERPYHTEDQTAEDIGARPLETFLQCINKSSIKVLYVHNYSDLSGDNIIRLLGLQEFYLSGAHSRLLSAEDILSFVSYCSHLKVLSIQNSFTVPENFMLPLLDRCNSLTSLTILNTRKEGESTQQTTSLRMLEALVRRTYPKLMHFRVDF